jgi:hypothetical protein
VIDFPIEIRLFMSYVHNMAFVDEPETLEEQLRIWRRFPKIRTRWPNASLKISLKGYVREVSKDERHRIE